MSAFLGKIHYWLYNKVKLHENLIDSMIEFSRSKGYDVDELIDRSYSKFGKPITSPLENEINLDNIHGWLQDRITSVESRMAFITTELLKNKILQEEELTSIFYKNGLDTMKEAESIGDSPRDMYKLIFDYMIEGMPCDRINEIVQDEKDLIVWKNVRDIHKQYWDEVDGDVNIFYLLRQSWINGFLSASKLGYIYTKNQDGLNTIRWV